MVASARHLLLAEVEVIRRADRNTTFTVVCCLVEKSADHMSVSAPADFGCGQECLRISTHSGLELAVPCIVLWYIAMVEYRHRFSIPSLV